MVFSSILFLLFFLPIFLICYYLLPRKLRNYVILFFSLVFYAWGSPNFVFFLIGSVFANFYLVRRMDQTPSRSIRRWLMAGSLFINLGLLFYFKYTNFFLENVNFLREMVGIQEISWERVVLPIGISFFTFQSITYSVDVYRKVHTPFSNPLNYLLYIVMFPQLLAGPIVRFQHIADQINNRRETWEEVLHGFYRFILGLSKKVLIADVLAKQVDSILLTDFTLLSTPAAWLGIIAYTFQLYFDFSGYSDMAIGLGRMMGFKFPENFNNPYISRSVTEFWRRWHITFSTFMRHYLYYPMGGSRVNTKRRLYFNLWFVFLISGLWHGSSWNFVIYGAVHGFIMVMERIFLLKLYDRLGRYLPMVITFFAIIMARVFFRLDELPQALDFFRALFGFRFHPVSLPFSPHFYTVFILAILFSFITLSRWGLHLELLFYSTKYSHKQHLVFFSVYMILLILSISSISGFGFSPFIYFRF